MIDPVVISKLLGEIPSGVKLVAVSKFNPFESIIEAYNLGIRDFGENRPQELSQKMDQSTFDIRWHFIGHLQRNKVRSIIRKVSLIHSVDSLKLAQEIDKEAKQISIVKDCLLQVRIAREETKQGIPCEELSEIAQTAASLKNIRICGLMGMATNTQDVDQIESEFSLLKSHFDNLKGTIFKNSPHFKEISSGMSSDWKIAIRNGSTIIRIGSLIFGER